MFVFFLIILTGLIKAAYIEPYCALSCPRNATKQRCTLPTGSCLHHVHRSKTYKKGMFSYNLYGLTIQ